MGNQTLNLQEMAQISAILEKEQPKGLNRFKFRLFSFSVFSWAVVYVVQQIYWWLTSQFEGLPARLVDYIAGYIDLQNIDNFLTYTQQFLGITSVILFVLNLGLIPKLWRQGELGRRIKLNTSLEDQYRRRRLKRGILLTVLVILIALSVLFYRSFLSQYGSSGFDVRTIVALGAAPAMLCIYLIATYFVRNGIDQLEAIGLLQESLQEKSENLKNVPRDTIEINVSDYDQIARLERRQIIQARKSSLKTGRSRVDARTFSVKKSHSLLDAVEKLETDTRLRVDQKIFELMSQPSPEKLATTDTGGRLRLHVSDTSLDLVYEVDHQNHLITLFSLDATDAGTGGVPREGT
jgi:mRNA-degrading endonuclease RelE of RelBE toxin-antitoxin system